MFNKQSETEAIVEDLIEKTIVESFADNFASKRECLVALELLISKLEDMDTEIFDNFFDN